MADLKEIRSTIERVVGEVFEARLPELRQELVKQVFDQVEPALNGAQAAPVSTTGMLEAGITSIEEGNSQAEILKAMLDAAAKFAGRVALFVVKGTSANAWQGRGFVDNGGIKGTAVDATQGLAARALADRMPVSAAAAEFDSAFIQSVGNPAEGNAIVVPLVVKEKVPGLVYADTGLDGKLDTPGVQVLVRAAGHWLEIVAARKAGASPPVENIPTPMPVERGVVAAAAAAAAAPHTVSAPPVEVPPPVEAEPEYPPEEAEIHKKAKRFAKLLVDEIKLYNQSKVAEGRRHKDLYDRLKEDIDKSRVTYEKRYGGTPAAKVDYFTQEVVRVLADNDISLLGGSFSH